MMRPAFLWEQANTQAASATKPEEFLKAANTYNRLVADGVRSGPLFLNLGSTLVLAGDGANAAACFARAERLVGATPETRQGLAATLTLQSGHARADLPWSRTAFVWHYAFPCTMRVLTTLGGWTLFWLGILCRILLKRRKERLPSEPLGDLYAHRRPDRRCVRRFHAHDLHASVTTPPRWGSRVFVSSSPSEMEDAP